MGCQTPFVDICIPRVDIKTWRQGITPLSFCGVRHRPWTSVFLGCQTPQKDIPTQKSATKIHHEKTV